MYVCEMRSFVEIKHSLFQITSTLSPLYQQLCVSVSTPVGSVGPSCRRKQQTINRPFHMRRDFDAFSPPSCFCSRRKNGKMNHPPLSSVLSISASSGAPRAIPKMGDRIMPPPRGPVNPRKKFGVKPGFSMLVG